MTNPCEETSIECSTERVFPCLYHCQKMLCLQHLAEHEEKILFREKLQSLWNSYATLFNENQVQEQIDALTLKLEHFRQMKDEIENLFDENEEAFQRAMLTVRRALEHEIRTKSILCKIEDKKFICGRRISFAFSDDEGDQTSSSTNEETFERTDLELSPVESDPSPSDPNGSSP